MRILIAIFALASAGLVSLRAETTNTAPVAALSPIITSLDLIGHGINLGNYLESPKEGAWGRPLKEEDFATIKQAGFATIRVPICWSAHVAPAAPYTIDPVFLARIDWVVAQAEKNQLRAILDYHNDGILMNDPAAGQERYLAIWKQVAEHFQNAPDSIYFELLNEPNKKLDSAHWNVLLAPALAIVRITNPTRTVVIGPAGWNGIGALKGLVLPDNDQHLLVTVHYYDPMSFTHQGAEWIKDSAKWMGNAWLGSDTDKAKLQKAFDTAALWAQTHHRPIFLGEFGSYQKGDIDSRVRWTTAVARCAEAHQMGSCYWEYSAGFGAFDPKANQWRKPLLDALLPP